MGAEYYVVLSRILQMDFREFHFHALGRIRVRRRAGAVTLRPLSGLASS